MRKNLDQEPEGGAAAVVNQPAIPPAIAGRVGLHEGQVRPPEIDTRTRPSSRIEGPVLSCAGYSDEPRCGPGERLEHLFEQRCDELANEGRADAVAVDGPNGALTYSELDGRANQLARHLGLRQRVRPGDRIGLLFDRPIDGYVAMLAVLKLHAAYVPLDPGFPADRVAYIASDAGARLVLTHSALADGTQDLDDVGVLFLDEVEVEVAGESDERLARDEAPAAVDDLCYVIYTSGTTGRPKGVAVSHPSIVNFVRVAAEVYGIASYDRVYQGLTIAFDFSIEEIWVGWMAGATLVPKPSADALLGADLHEFLTEHRVTALCCVPTLLATLEDDLPRLRFLLVSGESCPQDLVERWHRPGRRFLNVYGPTEATVSATWTLLDPSRPVTIGVPLPTYSVAVLDPDDDRALPPGSLGELALAGVGLAEGYLGRPELTARAFASDFLSMPANPSGRIYRTGDLVRLNSDGEIEHHGRIDTQVKIRGYRIEVGEIEAILRGVPGVSQAVVDAFEPQPGTKELVAYYTGSAELDPACMYDVLRASLPAYMIPAYLERLESVPMMTSGKVDRKALPHPSGARLLADDEEYVGPASGVESLLAKQLSDVLGVEHVSVESDFFQQLGASSLLMARFTARVRKAASDLPPISMREVYVNPTVRSLAAALTGEAKDDLNAVPEWTEPELPEPIGTPHYFLCGALQLLTFLGYLSLAALSLDAAASWIFAGHGAVDLYLRSALAGSGLLLGAGLLPIAAKWLVIGRFKPRCLRVWSFAYFRFWVVKTLLVSNPLAHLVVDTPLYALYLRLLGAKVAGDLLCFSHYLPVCTDLLSIGSQSVVDKTASLNCYRARSGVIEIGPVTVGDNAFVGERTVFDIYTTLEPNAQLGHASSVQSGQVVPAGECWHGSPARPAPPDYNYRTVPCTGRSQLRAVAYALRRLLLLSAVVAPIESIVGGIFLTHPTVFEREPVAAVLLAAGVALFALVSLSLIVAVTLPRLLSRALRPGRVYPVHGLHYSMQRLVARTSNNKLLTGLFGDSVAIVHYLRAVGYRFGVIEQTGSNFGLTVRQDVPALCHVGTGTMVSDAFSLMNAEFSNSSFRVMPTKVGKRNYVGTSVSFPAGARTADNCLFATKSMVPIGGPTRSDVGLLGSPCFEIPRSVERDKRFEEISTGAERKRRLAAKTRHNLVTMGLHLLVSYLFLLGVFAIAESPLRGTGLLHFIGTVTTTLIAATFMLALLILTERAVLGFRRLKPRYCSIYELEFWRHERYWKTALSGYPRVFDGTPFKPALWRLLGVRIGRRVFDDGLVIHERTLASIGDETTCNMGAVLQGHTLEDGVFKSDHILVGAKCTLGTGVLVNYDVKMEDGSVLEADSFVMKGSRVEAGARWRGNPATEVWHAEAERVVPTLASPEHSILPPLCERELEAA